MKLYPPLLLFLLILVLFVLSLYQRFPNGDEGLIAEHAYHLDKTGYVQSNLGSGYREEIGLPKYQYRQYFYHKLFVLTGALFMKVLGYNIYAFKAVSLLFAIILFVTIYFYLKRILDIQPLKPFFFLTASLLLFNVHIFDFSFIYRPEIMSITLGFISFYFLQKGLRVQNKYLWMVLSGVFAGLSALTHLNGVIYSFAGALLLLTKKEFTCTLSFSISAGIFTLLYFFDIRSIQEFYALFHQFTTDGVIATKKPFYISLLNEHKRFFHSPIEVTCSLSLLFSLFLNFKYLKNNFGDLLLYLLFLTVGLGLFAHGKTAYYGIHYIPYISIIIVAGCLNTFRQSNKIPKIIGIVLLAGFAVIHGIQNTKIIINKIDIAKHNAYLSSLIPDKNVKITAPSVFIFNEIFNYTTIRSEIAYIARLEHYFLEESKTIEGFLRFSCKHGDKYILIDKFTTGFNLFKDASKSEFNLNDIIADCQLIHKSDTYFIFKNLNIQ